MFRPRYAFQASRIGIDLKRSNIGQPLLQDAFSLRNIKQFKLLLQGEHGMVLQITKGRFFRKLSPCPFFDKSTIFRDEFFERGFAYKCNTAKIQP